MGDYQARLGNEFIFYWVFSSLCGYLMSAVTTFVLGSIVFTIFSSLSSPDLVIILAVFLLAFISGSVIGLIQWVFNVSLNIFDLLRVEIWMLANGVSGLFSFGIIIIFLLLASVMNLPLQLHNSQTTLFWYGFLGVFSVVLGLGLALPQWFALRPYFPRAGLLLSTKVVATVISVGLVVTVFVSSESDDMLWCSGFCFPVLFLWLSALGLSRVFSD